jgi:hypothetical protein
MRMIYRSIAMAAVAAMAFAGPAGAGPLAKAEVARLFPGQFEAKVKGYRVSFSGSRSGALQGEAYGQQDTGRWFMKGESLCVVWEKWTDGKPRCGRITQQGGWYVARDGGGEMLKFRRSDLAQK